MKVNKKIIIIFIILLLFNKSMANYISVNKFTKKTEIAKPIVNLEKDNVLFINKNSNENYYYFSITNFNGDNINEIKLKYNLELQYKEHDSIEIKLYKNNELVKLDNNKLYNNEISNIKQKDDYIVEIKYDESVNLYNEDIKEYVKIIINVEQL